MEFPTLHRHLFQPLGRCVLKGFLDQHLKYVVTCFPPKSWLIKVKITKRNALTPQPCPALRAQNSWASSGLLIYLAKIKRSGTSSSVKLPVNSIMHKNLLFPSYPRPPVRISCSPEQKTGCVSSFGEPCSVPARGPAHTLAAVLPSGATHGPLFPFILGNIYI